MLRYEGQRYTGVRLIVSDDGKGIYVFCQRCSRNIALDISEDEIQNSSRSISAVVCLHGDPPHAILAYIDKTLRVRGVEYPSAMQMEGEETHLEVEEDAISDHADDSRMDMGVLVESFGKDRKKGIDMLADLIIQVLLGNPVFLVHSNESLGLQITEGFRSLFEQNTSLTFLQPQQRESIKGPRESVFDLETKKLYVLGTKMENHFFRQLINQSLDDTRSFVKLRNELSKIMYSFSEMMDLLKQGSKRYTDTALAQEISIDFPLMPILMKMAESNGIRIKDRIQHDGLGSALRSI